MGPGWMGGTAHGDSHRQHSQAWQLTTAQPWVLRHTPVPKRGGYGKGPRVGARIWAGELEILQ